MPLTPGTRLGPYEIVSLVGSGGMGEVYRGRDMRLERDVAIKVMPPAFAVDPDRRTRFEREAKVIAALSHPNILAIFDTGLHQQQLFLVTELLDGQTLRDALRDGALPARKSIEIAIQLASGLAAAHEKGIVHRDLKPENVFVTKDGRVKILDFGLAKLAEAASTDGSRPTQAQTDPGMVVGTAGYMSPEQLRGEPVGPRSDIFSLGAVLYEMFTGQRAFKGKTAVDTMSAILNADPRDFPSGIQTVTPAIERVVRRCLEKRVDERFQSARDVAFAFDAISSASSVRSIDEGARAPRRRRPSAMTMLVAVMILTAAAIWFARSSVGLRPLPPPELMQLTFRNGDVRNARFSPDGKTVVYAAAWEDDPLQVFTMRPGSPESSPLNLPPANLLAVSSRAELALALNPVIRGPYHVWGTLARAALSGGAPRQMMETISAADWTPDSAELAAIFGTTASAARLEFPLGTVREETRYWLGDVRVSPDGTQAAYLAHVQQGSDGEVRVVGRTGPARTISRGWLSVEGLAWAPDHEIWVAGTRSGVLRAIWGITSDGRERLVYRAPGRLFLNDVASDGRALVTVATLRSEMRFGSLKDRTDRSLSWFDFGTHITMSNDAKLIAFNESGEAAGSAYGIFVRPTDGGPAVHLADGGDLAISPDGKWVLVRSPDPKDMTARLVPTGVGTARTISMKPLDAATALRWFPDSRHIAISGTSGQHRARTYSLDVSTGEMTPLTPEGTAAVFVSPDGEWIAGSTDGKPALFNLRTRVSRARVEEPGDSLVGWTADSTALFLSSSDFRRARLIRYDIASGARTEVATLAPTDPAGMSGVGNVLVAPDGDHYVYRYFRQLSQLFLIDLGRR